MSIMAEIAIDELKAVLRHAQVELDRRKEGGVIREAIDASKLRVAVLKASIELWKEQQDAK